MDEQDKISYFSLDNLVKQDFQEFLLLEEKLDEIEDRFIQSTVGRLGYFINKATLRISLLVNNNYIIPWGIIPYNILASYKIIGSKAICFFYDDSQEHYLITTYCLKTGKLVC